MSSDRSLTILSLVKKRLQPFYSSCSPLLCTTDSMYSYHLMQYLDTEALIILYLALCSHNCTQCVWHTAILIAQGVRQCWIRLRALWTALWLLAEYEWKTVFYSTLLLLVYHGEAAAAELIFSSALGLQWCKSSHTAGKEQLCCLLLHLPFPQSKW